MGFVVRDDWRAAKRCLGSACAGAFSDVELGSAKRFEHKSVERAPAAHPHSVYNLDSPPLSKPFLIYQPWRTKFKVSRCSSVRARCTVLDDRARAAPLLDFLVFKRKKKKIFACFFFVFFEIWSAAFLTLDAHANASSTALVIDNGSGMCKAGFAGDDAPRAVFPSSE